MMENQTLILLADRLAVCRLPADAAFPEWARPSDLLAFIATRDELSVVCAERFVPPEVKAERGWRALKFRGPLDFSEVGVLAALAQPLALIGVSIFALSTFDTDYILVKESALDSAAKVLREAGYTLLDFS